MNDNYMLSVKQLPHAIGLPFPAYQTPLAAGLDLVAAPEREIKLEPGGRALVPTGLVVELPRNCEAQIRPRSGLAFNAGVTVLNAPGTIDADYRGEIKVLLINHGSETTLIKRGDRIAQMVVAPVSRVSVTHSKSFGATSRGGGGFGSTGK